MLAATIANVPTAPNRTTQMTSAPRPAAFLGRGELGIWCGTARKMDWQREQDTRLPAAASATLHTALHWGHRVVTAMNHAPARATGSHWIRHMVNGHLICRKPKAGNPSSEEK